MAKTRVAIIGCGTIANAAHAPSYQKNPDVEIAYCVDIIPERAQALKEKFGTENTKAITDYHEMLKDSTVQAVSVCVPNYLHNPISIDCLRAGKDVLCEKPAAKTYALAKEMADAAHETGRILNIGVVNRFNKAVNMVKDYVDAGKLGEVYHVYCSFRAHRSIPGLGGPFTTKELAGGGVLIDWGVHYLDLINYVLGIKECRTVSGACYSKLATNMREYVYENMWAGPPDYNGTYDVEEYVTGFIRTDKATISLNGSWAENINDPASTFIEFIGDKGGIKLTYGGGFTFFGTKDGKLWQETPEIKVDNMFDDMFYEELKAFVECVNSGEHIRSYVDNNLITAQMMQGLYDSAELGKEVSF